VNCLVTLDAGTGSGRCVVFDVQGRVLAAAQEPFHYQPFVHPDLPLIRGFDLDTAAFWGVLARCARAALGQLPGDARPRAVIATAQREGCVFLAADGEVLYAGPNLDARAAMEGIEATERIGAERFHAITGHAPPYIFPVARYLWFRKHHDARRVATVLMLNDWITYRLSGERLAEHSNAGESMLYDVTRRDWSAELLDALDIPAAILPPLCAAGARVGRVTAAAAAATGIPEGTAVFAGGADTESALLGSGACEAGETGAVLGTTAPVQSVISTARIDPAGNLWTSCHVVPDRWVLESNAGDTGNAFRWLLELLFGRADDAAHAAAEAAVAELGPESRAVHSFLGPAIFNLRAMNPFRPAGVLFRFPLLHIDRPGRAEVLRGFLENVAFAIRANCEQIEAVTGVRAPTLHVSGGLTRSAALMRCIAASVRRPLTVASVVESASLGCAILAAVGAGLHPDLATAVAAMTGGRIVEPDVAETDALDERYRKWHEIFHAFHAMTI
jgi:autoinducer 2 (AI-2) kinase